MQEYTPEFTFAPELTGRRLDEISALLAVMDTGGFAPAARVLGRDASVLSRRVTALEQRLGIRLIERTTRSVKPTEAGARFAERMRAAIAAMTEAELEASDTGTAPRGTLRLALPGAFGRMWIAPLLPEFLSACPHVRIEAPMRIATSIWSRMVTMSPSGSAICPTAGWSRGSWQTSGGLSVLHLATLPHGERP
jgi:DNA-binding transcriptional LysR family regulator